MTDPLRASSLAIENCDDDCTCQNCHLLFRDVDGDCFAIATFSPARARLIAADLLHFADLAEAQGLKLKGALV